MARITIGQTETLPRDTISNNPTLSRKSISNNPSLNRDEIDPDTGVLRTINYDQEDFTYDDSRSNYDGEVIRTRKEIDEKGTLTRKEIN